LTKNQTFTLLEKLDPDNGNRRTLENTLVALVQLCSQCCHPLTGWLNRRERRKQLKRDIESVASRKVLKQLIALTKVAIEACSWVEEFHVTSLYVEDMMPPIRLRSPSAIAKQRASIAAKRRVRQEALDTRIQALKDAA
jgi:hypothetical protein